ncbi:hypothetical protein BGZ83_004491 [Gryganskiella cystojenkinii]|nr:hypothetical protein BGZ83_004491 [Gryganskiella cystojenkinii]
MASTNKPEALTVLIVGAGIGGLLLGGLLEKAGVSYRIFERAATVKPLGAALGLGPTILPALEQLGLLEELEKISLPCNALHLFTSDMESLGVMEMKGQKEIAGFENYIFTRPPFYSMLLRQIPPEKVHFNKKILQIVEMVDKVRIHCSDDSFYEGDILVGADGAYSTVRQLMYKDMSEKGILPKKDLEKLKAAYLCMVGVTDPLDTEKYPQLKDDFIHFATCQGGRKHTWNVINLRENKVAWGLGMRLDEEDSPLEKPSVNSEWNPDGNASMIKEYRDFPCPYGGTLGDLIDKTPEDLISKVFLEYKLFKTWFHGRTVLLGDGKFKLSFWQLLRLLHRNSMLPSGGQGATNAMQDAVILANCLYELHADRSQKGITRAFQSYYDQRFPHAKTQYGRTVWTEKIFSGQKWYEKLLRKILFSYLPQAVQQKSFENLSMYRPQATFIPMAPFRGTGPVLPQLLSKRYQKEQADKKKKEGLAVAVSV